MKVQFSYKKYISKCRPHNDGHFHYSDVTMSAMASQITSIWTVCSVVCLKKTSKLRITGICEGNPAVTGGFPSQRSNNAENVSIWWRHHEVGWVNRVPQTVEWAHDSHQFVIGCFLPPVVYWEHHRHGGLKFWRVARHIRWSSK